MFIPIKRKTGHIPTEVSKKSINRFIRIGIKIAEAKPVHFHQTLTFPQPFPDEKTAKKVFNKFMKGVIKYYGKYGLAALCIQEKRKNGETIHYHVCFLIFTPDRFPFAPSRLDRDFRTDLFKRWNSVNGGNADRTANALIQHDFGFDTINYFASALEIVEHPPKRSKTNWWGLWNKELINNCSYEPSKHEINHWFNEMFNKARIGMLTSKLKSAVDGINNGFFLDEWQRQTYETDDQETEYIQFLK